MAIQLQGDPSNLQGSVQNLQGGAGAAVLQPAGPVQSFGPVPSQVAPAPKPVQPAPKPVVTTPKPAPQPVSNVSFYKPDPNSQQVYDATGRPLSYNDYIAAGGRADFSNVLHQALPGQPQAQPLPTYSFGDGSTYDASGKPVAQTPAAPAATPSQGVLPVPTTPPAAPADPNQGRIDQLSKQIFNITVPSQQKLYEEAYNTAGLATVRSKLDELNAKIATKKQQITEAQGGINENPFLSENNRVGRVKRLNDQAGAELGNLLDEYKQYADLYNTGIDQVNKSVERQVSDFNNQRQVGTEELNYLLGIKKDTQAVQKDQTTQAATFQKDNNILSPFYKYPGSDTVYDTKTGKPLSYDEYKALGGSGKPGAAFQDVQTLQQKTDLKDYPASYQEYLLAKKDGFTGNYTDYQNADANRKAKAAGSGNGLGLTPNQINSTVNQIAGAFDNEPIVKNFNVLAEGKAFADSISNNTSNPADQQGLIYAFAKAMDPASVVREGEYATVQKYAQSWAQTFGFNAQRIFSNSPFLTASAIANMKATINSKYQAAKKNYDNVHSEYQRQIEGAYSGQPRQITDYSKAFDQSGSSGGSGVNLNDLF